MGCMVLRSDGSTLSKCPRCQGQMVLEWRDEEPLCLQCGFIAYKTEPDRRPRTNRLADAYDTGRKLIGGNAWRGKRV